MATEVRLSTREAALLLGCRVDRARILLQAAGIAQERIGTAFLWDAGGVAHLREVLNQRLGDRAPTEEAKDQVRGGGEDG